MVRSISTLRCHSKKKMHEDVLQISGYIPLTEQAISKYARMSSLLLPPSLLRT